MMRKLATYTLAAMLATSSAFAAGETFYRKDVQPGPYMVFGVTTDYEGAKNPSCYAEVTWRDGSKFQLIRDLADGELYIFFRNMTWNVRDEPMSTSMMRINFTNRGGVDGLNFQYVLVNKNTIVIRAIKKELFIPLFTNNSKMMFLMPGTIQNAEVDLTGSSKTLSEISTCVEAARAVDLYPQGAMQAPQPDAAPRRFNNI